jgi:hypothetical protein
MIRMLTGLIVFAMVAIDVAVLEDGPDPDALRTLVHKVKAVFGQT